MRFLLVDRLQPSDEGMRGLKLASLSEDYFEWHFPDRPVVPGMLVLESAVQTAGWWIAQRTDFASWLLLDRVNTARYYTYALPGHTIGITLSDMPLNESTGSSTDGFGNSGKADAGLGQSTERAAFAAACDVNGTRSAALEFEGRLVPLDSLMDPDAARREYERLSTDLAS